MQFGTCDLRRAHLLRLQLIFKQFLPAVQTTEAVDTVLILFTDLFLLSNGSLLLS